MVPQFPHGAEGNILEIDDRRRRGYGGWEGSVREVRAKGKSESGHKLVEGNTMGYSAPGGRE